MADKEKTTTITIRQSVKDKLQELASSRGGKIGRTAEMALIAGMREMFAREGVAYVESTNKTGDGR
jgi:hypothetical protein